MHIRRESEDSTLTKHTPQRGRQPRGRTDRLTVQRMFFIWSTGMCQISHPLQEFPGPWTTHISIGACLAWPWDWVRKMTPKCLLPAQQTTKISTIQGLGVCAGKTPRVIGFRG